MVGGRGGGDTRGPRESRSPSRTQSAERRAAAGQLLGGGGGGRKYQKTDPTTLGREGRERGIEEKIEGGVKKQKGRKKRKGNVQNPGGIGSARSGRGARLPPGAPPGPRRPLPAGPAAARLGLLFTPWSLFLLDAGKG